MPAMRCPTVHCSGGLRHCRPIERAAAEYHVFSRQPFWCLSQRSQCAMASHVHKLASALGTVKCVTSGTVAALSGLACGSFRVRGWHLQVACRISLS